MEEREYLFALCQMSLLGAASIRKLREHAGSYEGVFNIEGTEWKTLGILNEAQASELNQEKARLSYYESRYHSLEKQGIHFVAMEDSEYPERLKIWRDAPLGLCVKGKLPEDQLPSAAIIGARQATQYGRELAKCFGRELAQNGIQIVSGLAAGIDGAGHQGALEGGGSTFGILGCGVNICYPRENYLIYEEMIKTGGVISEFPLDSRPDAYKFPMRNRIISSLSDLVLVVEARERSGSLITAGYALDQGKDVFAIPGRITDPVSTGCNQLIQTGAGLVRSPEDLLEYFGVKYEKKLTIHEKSKKGLAKKEKLVYASLDLKPKHLENIGLESGLPVSECITILMDLELRGYVCSTGGNYYSKKF